MDCHASYAATILFITLAKALSQDIVGHDKCRLPTTALPCAKVYISSLTPVYCTAVSHCFPDRHLGGFST